MVNDTEKVRQHALRLLVRREHSACELQRKLLQRNYPFSIIQEVLSDLKQSGLQSDQRFAEAYVSMRISRGYGPLRIQQELQERGVAASDIATNLQLSEEEWQEKIAKVRYKRFKQKPANQLEKAKQIRFLQHRGFTWEQIQQEVSDKGM